MKIAPAFPGILSIVVATGLATGGCSDNGTSGGADAPISTPDAPGSSADARPPHAGGAHAGPTAIQATPRTWTRIAFPPSACDDASPTRIRLTPPSPHSN